MAGVDPPREAERARGWDPSDLPDGDTVVLTRQFALYAAGLVAEAPLGA